MELSDHDLRQIDAEYLGRLSHAQLLHVSAQLLSDLKAARDRANQTPDNSSRPPGSFAPWAGGAVERETLETSTPSPPESESSGLAVEPERAPSKPRKRRGKQPGSTGHGRPISLPVTGEEIHRARECGACGAALDAGAPFVARTGVYVLDVVIAAPGLHVTHVKHIYGESTCACGHRPQTTPGRCPAEEGWAVALTEWHLIGPTLAALIVCLALRMRLSRARIQELLHEWLGVQLSIGVLNQTITEGGRAVAPLEAELLRDVQQAVVLHVAETGWKEAGRTCWLWVLTSVSTTLFVIGSRSGDVIADLLEHYAGWLMSDGYRAYRQFAQRLRCLAHLLRKARGLAESVTAEAQAFGRQALDCLSHVVEAVYRARAGPPGDVRAEVTPDLAALCTRCEAHRDSLHPKTRQLAREFLNDGDTIWTVVDHPELPLTNNAAERALRQWVIARKLSYGPRTPQGSRAFTLLASVIETCRQREVSPWPYLASVIAARRQGNAPPPLPAAA